ncbi:hypothetical protein B9Z55_012731 [Caenorhabditis nigoni]|nr:hypothetical protein B9Z55_012731 [Caenorhabditis nigoni]
MTGHWIISLRWNSGIQVNIRSLRGQQSDREGANSLRQVKMSETGSHGSHRAPIQNRRKEAGINGSDFNSGGLRPNQREKHATIANFRLFLCNFVLFCVFLLRL